MYFILRSACMYIVHTRRHSDIHILLRLALAPQDVRYINITRYNNYHRGKLMYGRAEMALPFLLTSNPGQ